MKIRLLQTLAAAAAIVVASTVGAISASAQPAPNGGKPTGSASAAPAASSAPVPVVSAAPAGAPAPNALPPLDPKGADYSAGPLYSAAPSECKDLKACKAALEACQLGKKDCGQPVAKPMAAVCGSGTTGKTVSSGIYQTCECADSSDILDIVNITAGAKHYACVASAKAVHDLNGEMAVVKTKIDGLDATDKDHDKKIADLYMQLARLSAAHDQLRNGQTVLGGEINDANAAIDALDKRLKNVEKKIEKQPEGGIGPRIGFLAGPDGFNPTADIAIRFVYPLPMCAVAGQFTGGILDRTSTSYVIGRATAAAGVSCKPSDSVSVMAGGHGGQDIDGPGQRIKQDVEHFPGRDIGFHGEVDIKPTNHVLITIAGQAGAREVNAADGTVHGGAFVALQFGINLGNW